MVNRLNLIPPSLLYNGYGLPSPGVQRQGRGVNHPLPSSAGVKEREELYLYSVWALWPVIGRNLPFLPLPSTK